MVFASTMAIAATTELASRLNVVEVQEGVYKISYKPEGNNRVSLKIIDQDGRVILEERIKGSQAFVKKYNLSKQKEGDYTFKIKLLYFFTECFLEDNVIIRCACMTY